MYTDFVDMENYDLYLLRYSSAIDAGKIFSDVSDDFYGKTDFRELADDIGAFDYTIDTPTSRSGCFISIRYCDNCQVFYPNNA